MTQTSLGVAGRSNVCLRLLGGLRKRWQLGSLGQYGRDSWPMMGVDRGSFSRDDLLSREVADSEPMFAYNDPKKRLFNNRIILASKWLLFHLLEHTGSVHWAPERMKLQCARHKGLPPWEIQWETLFYWSILVKRCRWIDYIRSFILVKRCRWTDYNSWELDCTSKKMQTVELYLLKPEKSKEKFQKVQWRWGTEFKSSEPTYRRKSWGSTTDT